MGHDFAIDPTVYVRPTTYVRSNVFEDADLVDGNVEFWLDWESGPIRPYLGWDAGSTLRSKRVGAGAGSEVWAPYNGNILVDGSGRAYGATSAHNAIFPMGYSGTAPHTRSDVDMSCTVTIGTNGAGMIWRGEAESEAFFIYFKTSVGKAVIDKRPSSETDVRVLTGTTTVAAGETHTLRFTCISDVWTLYVDGVQQGSPVTDAALNTRKRWGIICKDTNSLVSNIVGVNTAACPATTYDVINDDGEVVSSGSVSGYKLSIPDTDLVQGSGLGPYGGYKLRLYGASSANYGTSKGDCQFVRVAPAIHTYGPKPHPFTDFNRFGAPGWDIEMRCFFGFGATRLAVTAGDVAGAAAYLQTHYVAHEHPSRPRHIIGHFHEDDENDAAFMTSTVNSLKHLIDAWEPRNEPVFSGYSGTTWVPKQEIFFNAVRAADPTAFVLGPNAVAYNVGSSSWHDQFYAAGGAAFLDEVSDHGYNATNGDIAMSRRLLDAHISRPARLGKAQWQTEQAFNSQLGQLALIRHTVTWAAVQLMVQETRGVTLERNVLWYDYYHGFSDGTLWENLRGVTAVPVMVRTMMDELGDRTFDSEFDLGAVADFYVAGKWNGTDGTTTVGLLAQSKGQPNLRFNLSGASTVVAVDAWGNQSTVSAVNGVVSFTVDTVPSWVRLPSGVTLTLVSEWSYGTNLALGATVTTSTSNTYNASSIVNGNLENQYDRSGGGEATGTGYNFVAWTDAPLSTYPQSITVQLAAPAAPTRCVLSAAPIWQVFLGTPVDFDIDVSANGSSWTTVHTHGKPAGSKTSAFVSDKTGTNTAYDTWYDPQTVWVVDLPGTTITHVRLVVREMSIGGHETVADSQATWAPPAGPGGYLNRMTVRELRLYDYADGEPQPEPEPPPVETAAASARANPNYDYLATTCLPNYSFRDLYLNR